MSIYEVDSFSKSDIFFHLVDKYVYRTKINQKFKDEVAKMDAEEVFNRTVAIQHLQKLFDKSKAMKYLYGSPDEMIHILNQVTKFPDNSEYLGLKDSANMTFFVSLAGKKGKEYVSKSEAFVAYFYPRVAVLPTSDFEQLAINFIGNEIYRGNKDNFQLIEREYFVTTVMKHFEFKIKIASGIEHHFHKGLRIILEKDKHYVNGMGSQIREEGIQWTDEDDKLFEHILNHETMQLVDYTVDEVYEKYAALFDRNYDEKCFKKLRQLVEEENKVLPIAENLSHYQKIYSHILINWRDLLRFYFGSEAFTRIYPNIRLFVDKEGGVEKKFFLAKDLLRILEMLMSEKVSRAFPKGLISIENEEERKMGILRVVEYDTFEQILKIFKISIDSINLVKVPLKSTDRGDIIPVNSPYGTYCKLAKHAFSDVFEQISIGMNLWKSMDKQNFPKVFEFFEKLTENDEVFSVNRDYRYFVETWKIEQIIDLAYEELLKYSTTNMYVFPNKKSKPTYSQSEAKKELKKFAPNFENQQKLIESYENVVKNEKRPITQKIIGVLHERGIRNAFVECHSKIGKFMENQENPRRVEIGCCSDVKKISFAQHSEMYRETIKRVYARFVNGSYISKNEFDELIENEMKNDVEHYKCKTEEDKQAHMENLQLIAEYFETKTVNNIVFLRRFDEDDVAEKNDEQLYETPSGSSHITPGSSSQKKENTSQNQSGNKVSKQKQAENLTAIEGSSQGLKENVNSNKQKQNATLKEGSSGKKENSCKYSKKNQIQGGTLLEGSSQIQAGNQKENNVLKANQNHMIQKTPILKKESCEIQANPIVREESSLIQNVNRILRENTNLNSIQKNPTETSSQIQNENQIPTVKQENSGNSNMFCQESRFIREVNKLFSDRNKESRQKVRRFLDNLSLIA